ncbi:hypothetical protein NE865_03023 [Phthorimaea operculella]|nr:hypothetical protein NE865_03023 [Phthorimaea operculella]
MPLNFKDVAKETERDRILSKIKGYVMFGWPYRNCAHSTTGISPAEALQGRRLRSRLDALRPDRAAAVRSAQHRQEQAAPAAPRPRSLSVGDTVLARDYTAKGGKWSEGTVAKKTGPVSYKVDMGQGLEWRRHVDQLISTGKNRFSLARASTAPDPTVSNGDKETEGAKEGEAEGATQAVELVNDNVSRESVSPPQQVLVEKPQAPEELAPPPPGASARALRAYQRAQKFVEQID